ncbi:hypothetical protein ACLOJK_032166 [Asimina triloba]
MLMQLGPGFGCRHVNEHLVEDELARDRDLARQIAAAPSPPISTAVEEVELLDFDSGAALGGSSHDNTNDFKEAHIQEKISCLVCLQLRSVFYKVEGGLMALLKKCLEMESGKSISIISAHIDHFQSIQSEDSGWGCGWRNIQMLSSHLLTQRQEAREVMFGGSEFVPDIPSLQRWLEIAWERGFDMTGSDSFNHKVYGSKKWIGTTECAALFRSFGLRGRIVDFGRKMVGSSSSAWSTVPRTQAIEYYSRHERKAEQAYGPMDKFLRADNSKHKTCKQADVENGGDSTASSHWNSHKITDDNPVTYGHQLLADWVWSYFSDESFSKSGNSECVHVSRKT